MTFYQSARTALRGLQTNKTRSLLTVLGIVIGITAIIVVMSLGRGAQELILGQVRSIGSKVIAVVPGRQPKGPADALATFTDSLKEKDLKALEQKANVPHLVTVMPVVFGSEVLSVGNDTYRSTVFGVTQRFSTMYDLYPSEGRLYGNEEIKQYADVVLIGAKVKKELFGGSQALGEKIKIRGRNFRVIGVYPPKGQVSFFNFDEATVVPYTTAQRSIFGIKHYNRLIVEADSEEHVVQTVEDIRITLRNSHAITDPAKDDFFIETQVKALETVSTITNVLTLFLAAVAAISLIVGGVGIMNIMLVSVTERTREIGLRKALGATQRDILLQFLLESTFLTISGGLLGIALGASISYLVSLVLSNALELSWQFTLPLSAVALGLGVAGSVGLLFGIYPAHMASKKSPMEALRYE